jgi:hypothetical protein
MRRDQSPDELVALYTGLGRRLSQSADRSEALATIAHLAVDRVPGTDWASVSEGRNGTFVTVAATDDSARQVDEIQYALGTGPCVDAIRKDLTFRTGDLRHDDRWPEFGQRAADGYRVSSMLSLRLYLEADDRIAGLNLYSTSPDAFDDDAEVIGTLLATHGALAILAATAREQAAHLETALRNSRDIGTAMGVLMSSYKVRRQEAFDLLRIASQNTNRKLAEIAADVADTGTLDLPALAREVSSRRRS